MITNRKPPTHLKVFFTRAVRMQYKHIAGAQAPAEGQGQVIIVQAGDEKSVEREAAIDLIISEAAIEVKPENAAAITAAKSLIEELATNQARIEAKEKAAQKKAA